MTKGRAYGESDSVSVPASEDDRIDALDGRVSQVPATYANDGSGRISRYGL